MTKALAFETLESRITGVFLLTIAALIISYIYFVNSSVFNIMARRQAEERISTLGTQVASLESRYIELSSAVDLELAHKLGFREVEDTETKYTARIMTPTSLSLASLIGTN